MACLGLDIPYDRDGAWNYAVEMGNIGIAAELCLAAVLHAVSEEGPLREHISGVQHFKTYGDLLEECLSLLNNVDAQFAKSFRGEQSKWRALASLRANGVHAGSGVIRDIAVRYYNLIAGSLRQIAECFSVNLGPLPVQKEVVTEIKVLTGALNRTLEDGLKGESVDAGRIVLMLPHVIEKPPAWLEKASIGTYVPTVDDLTVLLDNLNSAHIGEILDAGAGEDVTLARVVKRDSPEAASAIPVDVASIKESYDHPMVYALVGVRMIVTDIRARRLVRPLPISVQYEVLRAALEDGVLLYPRLKVTEELVIAFILGAFNTHGVEMPVKFLRHVSKTVWEGAWKKVGEAVARKKNQHARWEQINIQLVSSPNKTPDTTAVLDCQGEWATIAITSKQPQAVELRRAGMAGKDHKHCLDSLILVLDNPKVTMGAKVWALKKLIPCCDSKEDVLRLLRVFQWAARVEQQAIFLLAKKRIAAIDLYYL
jgi:hypothetical protein